jgi:hypothetical protein
MLKLLKLAHVFCTAWINLDVSVSAASTGIFVYMTSMKHEVIVVPACNSVTARTPFAGLRSLCTPSVTCRWLNFSTTWWHYLLLKICLLTNKVSRLRYSNTSRWAPRNKPTCCISSSLSLHVRLFKATEAALLSGMMVFTAILLKARIFCHVMKCPLVNSYRPIKRLQPVETSVIVYRPVATCDKTWIVCVLPNDLLRYR